jgi:hypothetical protein
LEGVAVFFDAWVFADLPVEAVGLTDCFFAIEKCLLS